MRYYFTRAVLMMVMMSVMWTGCTVEEQNPMTAAELQTLLDSALRPGDSKEKIKDFLVEHGLPYDFDPYQQRYQSHWPTSETKGNGVKSSLAIWIYVDEDGLFKEAVAEEVFTYL